MKKIFALALAALMTAGMTTVAFAASDKMPEVFLAPVGGNHVYVDANDDGKFATDDDDFESNGATVDKGALVFYPGQSVDVSVIEGGTKVAIPLYTHVGEKPSLIETTFNDKDILKSYKIKAEWSVGDLDEKPEFELVKVGGIYVYAITFTVPEGVATKTTDLSGNISVYKSSSDLKDTNEYKPYITLAIGSEYGYVAKSLESVEDDLANADLVEFKYEDGTKYESVETLAFGEDFEFEVDVTGQGKLNLKNNRDFNKEFAAMYDYANVDFINFVYEPSFNKNGTVYLYADQDAFIYEVTADGAKEIKGLKWDEDYEAWTFKTRTLSSYAISDVELTEKTVTEDKDESSSTTEDGGKQNPDTGR